MKEFDSRPFEDYVAERVDASAYSYDDLRVDSQRIAGERRASRKRAKRRKIGLGVGFGALGLGAVSLLLIPFFQINPRWQDWSVRRQKAQYDPAALKALNAVRHPIDEGGYNLAEDYPVSEEYVAAMNDFAFRAYPGLAASPAGNALYSPYSLYRIFDLASLLTDDPEAESLLSSALGSATLREENREDAYRGLNWASKHSDDFFEVRDALFLEESFSPYRFEVIGEFTRAFVEAFAADFSSEEGYRDILAWARGNSIDSDLLSLDDVLPSPSDDPARFMMLNVLNASLSWRNTFAAEDNVRAPFHLPNGEEKEIAYLHHAKRDAIVYDYGTYVSAYDDYDRSYTIQYLVPKSLDASIFDLLAEEGRNFLREEEEKRIVASEGADAGLILDLFVPKFTATARVDFSSAAEALGLKPLFTGEAGSFDRAFENAPEAIRLVSPKQVNRVSFTEDGTTVSTIAFMLGAGAAQPITGDEIRVELNQPFVYVIRDARGLPLYIGTNVSGD